MKRIVCVVLLAVMVGLGAGYLEGLGPDLDTPDRIGDPTAAQDIHQVPVEHLQG